MAVLAVHREITVHLDHSALRRLANVELEIRVRPHLHHILATGGPETERIVARRNTVLAVLVQLQITGADRMIGAGFGVRNEAHHETGIAKQKIVFIDFRTTT